MIDGNTISYERRKRPDHALYKRVNTTPTRTATTRYVGGKLYEAIDRNGTLERKHCVGSFAVITTSATGVETAHDVLHDRLGSIDTMTDGYGAVADRSPILAQAGVYGCRFGAMPAMVRLKAR